MTTKRQFWIRLCSTFVLILILSIVSFSTASAESEWTKFVNLSDSRVRIATWRYQPYQPRSSPPCPEGSSCLPSITPEKQEGWWFHGWTILDPGDVVSFRTDNKLAYYFKNSRGRQLTWANKSETTGFITNWSFDTFVPRNDWRTKLRKLEDQGYRRVTFQKFPAGIFTISGDAYRIAKKTFSFNIKSRAPKYDGKYFHVPGRIVDYSVDNWQSWRAENVSWSREDTNTVSLLVYVSGKQKRPFGPREPGYYRGNVTIRYTTPK